MAIHPLICRLTDGYPSVNRQINDGFGWYHPVSSTFSAKDGRKYTGWKTGCFDYIPALFYAQTTKKSTLTATTILYFSTSSGALKMKNSGRRRSTTLSLLMIIMEHIFSDDVPKSSTISRAQVIVLQESAAILTPSPKYSSFLRSPQRWHLSALASSLLVQIVCFNRSFDDDERCGLGIQLDRHKIFARTLVVSLLERFVLLQIFKSSEVVLLAVDDDYVASAFNSIGTKSSQEYRYLFLNDSLFFKCDGFCWW